MSKKAIIDSLHIDDEGLKDVKTIDINDLSASGIIDIAAFLKGLLDAENNKEFNESSKDYIKGYKYGKTGDF